MPALQGSGTYEAVAADVAGKAVTDVVVDDVLATATQLAVFPVFGIQTGVREHLTIGLTFVGASLARGYALRRLLEAIRFRRE